jgi:hypothetical protein
MMRPVPPIVLVAALLAVSRAAAAAVPQPEEGLAGAPCATPQCIEAAYQVALQTIPTLRASSPAVERIETDANLEPRPKSATTAMLLSAVVPGLGQFYGGHPKLGVTYLGLEAAGWASYSVLRSSGNEKREDSRVFADAHYDSVDYRIKKDEDPVAPPNRELPYEDDIEYYEDIAKLNEVIWGWDDHAPGIDPVTQQEIPGASPNRNLYQGMRDGGNTDLRAARNISLGIFVNHVVSAIHAFKLVQWYNQNLNRELSGYKIKLKQTRDKDGVLCVVSKKF